jgi:DNA-directed RNA polymerase specialized sigma24 family protein
VSPHVVSEVRPSPPPASAQPEFEELRIEAALDERRLRVMLSAAKYHAGRIAGTLRLDDAARDDAEQEILLTILERRHYFDPSRGAWTTFVNRIARQAAQSVADDLVVRRKAAGAPLDEPEAADAIAPDALTEHDIYFIVALERRLARLPEQLRVVALAGLYADGDLADAQRTLGLSTSEFYRRVQELRYRLVAFCFVDRRRLF